MPVSNKRNEDAPADRGGGTPQPQSRQVSWFAVFQFVERWWTSKSSVDLDLHLPIAGTQPWCDLPDDDARKLLAVLLGGIREALHHEVVQELRGAASREIAASQNWATQAKRLIGRSSNAYIPIKKDIA